MSDEKIANALGLRNIEEIEDAEFVSDENDDEDVGSLDIYRDMEITDEVSNDFDDQHIKDIELARDNIEKIVKTGSKSMDQLAELARQSESPRAYEVVSTMMKTLLDANKDFVDMSEKRKYAKEERTTKKGGTDSNGNVTNNNLIVSSSNDIFDILEKMKEEKDKKDG